jgi:hypothetical protein
MNISCQDEDNNVHMGQPLENIPGGIDRYVEEDWGG